MLPIFSVSGLRGIAGKDLTHEKVAQYAYMFGMFIKQGKVVIGRDTRESGLQFRNAVVQGLHDAGCAVVDLGIAPTPTVVYLVKNLRAQAGIVITASHNPIEWNALKFISSKGRFLNAAEHAVFKRLCSSKRAPYKKRSMQTKVEALSGGIERHIARICKVLNITQSGLKVGVDAVNGAGSVALPHLLEELGCKVFPLYCTYSPAFPREPEPSATHLKDLSRYVVSNRLDLGMACDPDCDRLALVDGNGHVIGEDRTLVLCCELVLRRSQKPVVTNLSTTSLLDHVAQKYGVRVYRTKVGEAHVVARMEKVNAVIGGEGNGGVIYPRVNLTRDALVAAALIVKLLEKERSLSALCDRYPKFYMIKKKIKRPAHYFYDRKDRLVSGFKGRVNTSDGVRITTKDYWLHVRPSQTEPLIRIIGESTSLEMLMKQIRTAVRILTVD
jgi:phosphomannomutase